MTTEQKAKAWEILKVAANHSIKKTGLGYGFLVLIKEIEMKVCQQCWKEKEQ